VDARSAPQVGGGHLLDKPANLGINGGRPPLGRLRQAQYLRNPDRCHLITVAGFTMISASLQLVHRRDSSTQRRRSVLVSRGRLTERFNTPSWCRRASTSTANWRRVLKKARAARSKERRRFSTAGQPGLVAAQLQRSRGGRCFWDAHPGASSGWSGIDRETSEPGLVRIMWIPRCRRNSHPERSST
jgi:hypothetical protein